MELLVTMVIIGLLIRYVDPNQNQLTEQYASFDLYFLGKDGQVGGFDAAQVVGIW